MKRVRWYGTIALGAIALLATGCPADGGGSTGNQAPTAMASASPSSGLAPLAVDFSSAGSFDPEGTALTYSWNFGDGSALDTSANPSHTYSVVGSYTAKLTVTDAAALSGSKTVAITVNGPANVPPVATMTAAPQTGKIDLSVHFDGSASTDSDGTIASYSWDFGDGSTGTGATADHTYTTAGSIVATLTVTDDDGGSTQATQTIEVTPNQSPIAVANGLPLSGKEPLTVGFSSAGSADADGTIASYSWNFGDGSASSNAANPTHVYQSFGSFHAVLTVTDDNGSTGQNSVDITVNANQPPVSVANATPTGGYAPLTVLFDGSGSSDPDGSITAYLWTFDDGSFSTFPSPSHTYAAIGTYHASLKVTDDNGATHTSVVDISVNGIPNVAPTAVAGGTPASGKVPLSVSFSSAGSTDPDGTILAYHWDFGDGTASSVASPSHVYTTSGTKVATLTVTDNYGAVGTDTVTTVVNPNQAPSAVASAPVTTGKEPLTVAFSSAGSSV